MASRMNLHKESPFYKSLHLLSCFEPTQPGPGATIVKRIGQIPPWKREILRPKRRGCSCLLSCAWDDKHWEAFIWVLFSRFSLHKDEQWTSLIPCKRFGAFQNHKTSIRNSQSARWEAAATGLCHFLKSLVTNFNIWCYTILQRALATQKSRYIIITFHNTLFAWFIDMQLVFLNICFRWSMYFF